MEELTALFSELRCREVINLCDGSRLGYVTDVRMDLVGGRVLALCVPSDKGLLGMLGTGEDLVIPWENIEKIGEDIIFIRIEREVVPPKRFWFGG